jgi:hypothetical protein
MVSRNGDMYETTPAEQQEFNLQPYMTASMAETTAAVFDIVAKGLDARADMFEEHANHEYRLIAAAQRKRAGRLTYMSQAIARLAGPELVGEIDTFLADK